MSLDGLEKLRMGYVPPRPPPILPLVPDGVMPAITLDDAFDAWVATPVDDLRTLQEYASNPVPLVRRLPMPPPPPPSRVITGAMRSSVLPESAFVLHSTTCFHDPDPEDRCPHGGDYRLCKQCRIGSERSRGPLGID